MRFEPVPPSARSAKQTYAARLSECLQGPFKGSFKGDIGPHKAYLGLHWQYFGLSACYLGCLKGVSTLVQVPLNGIGAVLVLTLIVLNQRRAKSTLQLEDGGDGLESGPFNTPQLPYWHPPSTPMV